MSGYRYKAVPVGSVIEIANKADRVGREGWRLVAIEKDPASYHGTYGRVLIFERKSGFEGTEVG